MASESYADFVGALQRETKDVLYERPTKATVGYFTDKQLKWGGELFTIDETQTASIIANLADNDYIDKQGHITEQYHKDAENNTLEPLPKKLWEIAEAKGSMDSMTLRRIEEAKIKCAEQLFNDISTSQVRYHKVDNYEHMLDVIQGLE